MLRKLGIFFLAIGLAKIAWYLIWKDRKYTEQLLFAISYVILKKVIAIIEGKKISDKQRRIRKDIREH